MMPLVDEIEAALADWFDREHAVRHSRNHGGATRDFQEEDRDRARRYLAEKLGELGL